MDAAAVRDGPVFLGCGTTVSGAVDGGGTRIGTDFPTGTAEAALDGGLTVAAGWWYTYFVASDSFQLVQVQGLTFSGPSAEWLMRVLAYPAPPIGFDFGLLPGVFAGSFIGAWIGKDLKLEGFHDGYGMRRYIVGAILMGFGSMLAGGCAVGAGMSGGAIFALTAWLALSGMWAGAGITDRLLDSQTTAHGNRVAGTPANMKAP